jgi:hypothetical protein
MTDWNALSYDEQRALLGLPDVRAYVAGRALQQLGATLRETFPPAVAEFALAFTAAYEGLQQAVYDGFPWGVS